MKYLRCAALAARAASASASLYPKLRACTRGRLAVLTNETCAAPHPQPYPLVCNGRRLVLLVCAVLGPAAATGAAGARRALHADGALAPGPGAGVPLQGHAAGPAAAVAGADADAAQAQAQPGGAEEGKPLFDYKDMGAALANLILLQARLQALLSACARRRAPDYSLESLCMAGSTVECAHRCRPGGLCWAQHTGALPTSLSFCAQRPALCEAQRLCNVLVHIASRRLSDGSLDQPHSSTVHLLSPSSQRPRGERPLARTPLGYPPRCRADHLTGAAVLRVAA